MCVSVNGKSCLKKLLCQKFAFKFTLVFAFEQVHIRNKKQTNFAPGKSG